MEGASAKRAEAQKARANADPSPFDDPAGEWRRVLAEAWGAFLLALAAAGGAIEFAADPAKVTAGMAAVAPGLTVMAVIYMLGDISGAHLNPAVTFAFAVRRNFPWRRVPAYVAAQLFGALLAVGFLALTVGHSGRLGATTPSPELSDLKALAIETVLSAGLVTTILGSASGARNVGPNAALAVGGYVALAGLWASPLTGASMNPARSLAPDLWRGELGQTWIYIVGPALGALLAVAIEHTLKGPPTAEGSKTAQGDPPKE